MTKMRLIAIKYFNRLTALIFIHDHFSSYIFIHDHFSSYIFIHDHFHEQCSTQEEGWIMDDHECLYCGNVLWQHAAGCTGLPPSGSQMLLCVSVRVCVCVCVCARCCVCVCVCVCV